MHARAPLAAALLASVVLPPGGERTEIHVKANPSDAIAPMARIWAMFGYDEPNYTYSDNGRKLLGELAELSPVPVYVRTHNLLTSGDGTAALKWGSTNAYTEEADGHPKYDWTIVDRIFDTYLQRKMKPIVEIGFMPEALSTHPVPYQHHWQAGTNAPLFTGWSYPPKDYDRWRDLVSEWARHSIQRYGRTEVESWYWEVWNEPDIGYWHGTPDEYFRLYDYAADGLKRVLPSAQIGGPTTTNPNGQRAREFLRSFLEHCARGANAATGKTGAPLDYVSFHAKGAPRVVDGHVRMGLSNQLRAISDGFELVAAFPEFKRTPVIIGESDPEGCAACGVRTNPENAYRNGTMYSSYTAEQLGRTYQLAARSGVNLRGTLTWAFEFEGQPYFDGFRDLATNGLDKPVLNVFRMLGKMTGSLVPVDSSGSMQIETIREGGVRAAADISAIATRADRSVDVLVWNYHDDDVAAPDAAIDLTIDGLTVTTVTMTHERVDADHSNAYDAWKRMGSPQPPSPEQYRTLEAAGHLQTLEPPHQIRTRAGTATVLFMLPRQGVSLIRLSW